MRQVDRWLGHKARHGPTASLQKRKCLLREEWWSRESAGSTRQWRGARHGDERFPARTQDKMKFRLEQAATRVHSLDIEPINCLANHDSRIVLLHRMTQGH